MTAISQTRRAKFPTVPAADTAPELAYLLAQTAAAYFQRTLATGGGANSIATVNLSVLGAFEQAKSAFNDSVVRSYEDARAKEHGPVFGTFENPVPGLLPKEAGLVEDFFIADDEHAF